MPKTFDEFCDMAWANLKRRPGERDPRKLRRLDVTHEAWRLLANKGAEFDAAMDNHTDDHAYMDRLWKIRRFDPFIMRLGFWDVSDKKAGVAVVWIVTGGVKAVEVVCETVDGLLIPVVEGEDEGQDMLVHLARLWTMTLLHFESNRPEEFRMRRAAPVGVRQRLNAHKHERVITVSLTKPEVVLIGEPMPTLTTLVQQAHEASGRKVCEHEVRPFTRRLRDGRLINVRGHRRGDPNVPRKTIYRVVP